MSSRLGSLLYAAALVVVLGAGCAVPPAAPIAHTSSVSSVPQVASTSSVFQTPTATGVPTALTLSALPTSAATSSSSSRLTTASTARTSSATRAGTTAAQGCGLPPALLGKDITVLPGTAKVVALTFDAGANANGVPSILGTLASRHATGTFFLTGTFVAAFSSASREISATYPIGNHTQDHKDLTTLTTDDVRGEIRTGAASILRVTGVDPRPYFRFPYGAVNASLIGTVNADCYVPFRWTVDSWGWKGTAGGMSSDEVLRRVVGALRPGAIVLMHVGSNPDDGTTFDADALPRVIDQIRAQGYTLVTLENVLPATP